VSKFFNPGPVVLLLLCIACIISHAQTPATITLPAAKDNTIYERTVTNSNGAGEQLIAGTTGSPYFNRALLMFNLSGIPSNAIITHASLQLHVNNTSGNSGPYELSLYRLLKDWGEGTSNAGTQAGRGAPATTNDATWVNTFYPSSNWTNPGGDFHTTSSAMQTVNDTGFYAWSSPGLVADLQNWINNPLNNFGWLLKSNESAAFQAKRFESRENIMVANRPALTVTYVLNHHPVINITNPQNDTAFAAGGSITIRAAAADADGTISKVEFFYINGPAIKLGEVTAAPYQLAGADVEPGAYPVFALATDNLGAVASSDTVIVNVTGCTGSGTLSLLGYTGVPGENLVDLSSHINFPSFPDVVTTVNQFEYGPNAADNYGAKLRGYICAPATGFYTFYISGDNQCELWLSTDDDPANINRIAYLSTRVNFRSWFSFPTQRSVPIKLIRGARYYIETVHKEGTQQDHLSVGWILPNNSSEAPIPGSRLSPYGTVSMANVSNNSPAQMKQLMQKEEMHGLSVTVLQNPAPEKFKLLIKSNSHQPVSVRLVDITGKTVEYKTQLQGLSPVEIGNNLPAGLYVAEITQGAMVKRVKLVKQ
jgi:hypothetical protein